MMFLTKLMLLTAAETDADLSTVLEETKAVAEEVHEDLQNLKPNVILETVKSWLPGLMSFGLPSGDRHSHSGDRKPDRACRAQVLI